MNCVKKNCIIVQQLDPALKAASAYRSSFRLDPAIVAASIYCVDLDIEAVAVRVLSVSLLGEAESPDIYIRSHVTMAFLHLEKLVNY